MDVYEIRPLYDIGDEELNFRLEKLQKQGLTKAELAKTQEGKECKYRHLSYDTIVKKTNEAVAAGIDPMQTPEYLERVRRRQMEDR